MSEIPFETIKNIAMEEPTPEKCYRQRRVNLYLGLGLSVVLCITGVGFILTAFMNPNADDFPAPAAIIVFTIWSFFLVLGIWAILSYLRERLLISETRIIRHDLFGKTVISVDEISQLNWYTGFGAIRLDSPGRSIVFNMESFTKPEQSEIITFLRNHVALEKHKNWDYFYEGSRRVIEPGATATRQEKILASVVLALAGVFFCGWWFGSGSGFLLPALLCVFGALRIYQGH
ncbi:MAG TPA: hypothetical protein DIT97_28580 [Gimesia maris]|uniref:DUF304 domain-containing protein n=1 Tax=Gimesia maris TaxID=122 RepID=A0A3D3RD55_9PLAN|nr:hypothetical protein [Gimesia maris]